MRGFAILDLRFALFDKELQDGGIAAKRHKERKKSESDSSLLCLLCLFVAAFARNSTEKSQIANLKSHEPFQIRLPSIAQESRVHRRCGVYAGAGHWGQCRDLFHHQHHSVQATPYPASRATRRRLST